MVQPRQSRTFVPPAPAVSATSLEARTALDRELLASRDLESNDVRKL